MFALVHQLRDELTHPLVAPNEHRRVMVVADARVIHHVPEVADDFGRGQIVTTRRNQRLVHVQRSRKSVVDVAEINAALRQKHRLACRRSDGGRYLFLGPANVRALLDIFSQFSHNKIRLFLTVSPVELREMSCIDIAGRFVCAK